MIKYRKIKTLNNKTGGKIKKDLSMFIKNYEKYKNCFFWGSTGNASYRRKQEFDNAIEFNVAEQEYYVRQCLEISCKNFYFKTIVMVDGQKKDIRTIKKLLI